MSTHRRRASWVNLAFGLRMLHHVVIFLLFCGAVAMAVLGGICYFGYYGGGGGGTTGTGYCANIGTGGSLALFVVGVVLFGLLLIYSIIFCCCMFVRDDY